MNQYPSIKLFAKYPWATAVLALLTLCLGFVFVNGWVPNSLNRPYFPGHEWFMAAVCWALALFFAYCARLGFRQNGSGKN